MKKEIQLQTQATIFKKKIVVSILFLLIVIFACIYIKLNPILFFTEFHFLSDLLNEMMPPNYQVIWNDSNTFNAIGQTLSMAFLGTLIGGLVSLVLSFFAASTTMHLLLVRWLITTMISLIRSIPSIVFILIFIIAVGIGPFAGVLTLIFITIGTFGKLFTEMLEHTDRASSEGLNSVGASKIQVIRYAILPEIQPAVISNFLYAFDINLRTAIGLGIFGGGGLGYQLYMAIRVLHYKDVLALIIIIICLVISIEKISDGLRNFIFKEGKL
ncbi:MAG: phosphonate ABC transporter, permease protein PhnE [Chitinophagaceae bacterium]|nr:phosphonate ABC transporter, permease protein PhnE [Chitinophagaceae bacterium]